MERLNIHIHLVIRNRSIFEPFVRDLKSTQEDDSLALMSICYDPKGGSVVAIELGFDYMRE